ncbi:quinate 5-dehydrogenase [Caldicellulosiruptor changbaiensis]|uniref:Quinate 5-dehydrogenase n=1 Tax=Caldicellulosiruptor changbaiensis TaxID=1222016 RepID=A0A3T0D7J6_9FIRM|nr:quinate 5-dehydrogenase [Caldicellulosiruptor changbaiensis]AZT91087.1 quinate 5-dehydrogenase [Caldicellulosiruptor changbaiensis]
MKRVVSVSIGSSKRNHKVFANIKGVEFEIERIGTDGDIKKAIEIIKSLDGKVDAFGMGGIDIVLYGGGKNYVIREAIPIKDAAKKTPLVDGTGVKNTFEKWVIKYLQENNIIDFKGKTALVVCALDRYKLAEGLYEAGCRLLLGDALFALGIPFMIKSLKTFYYLAALLVPFIIKLPFSMLYPNDDKKEQDPKKLQKYWKYYKIADIIAGDYKYIQKYMPDSLENKIIITNTITKEDVEDLKARKLKMLVTTTPEFDGRSFGTNVVEAILVALTGKRLEEMSQQELEKLIKEIDFKPRVEIFY